MSFPLPGHASVGRGVLSHPAGQPARRAEGAEAGCGQIRPPSRPLSRDRRGPIAAHLPGISGTIVGTGLGGDRGIPAHRNRELSVCPTAPSLLILTVEPASSIRSFCRIPTLLLTFHCFPNTDRKNTDNHRTKSSFPMIFIRVSLLSVLNEDGVLAVAFPLSGDIPCAWWPSSWRAARDPG